ncbi:MAG: hypothetical protein EAX86_13185 [Candidatus Heimdallarchaeota archaeon]|nr:hypothetical protein [Candidatus Heimdallarchaeota archaeon]
MKLLEELPQDPSRVIRDYFPITEDRQLDRIYSEYRLGAYLLRLVAATNRRLEAWLIELEGDLFERLYDDRANPDEKKTIFQELFGKENVMEYEVFKYKNDEKDNQNLAALYQEYHSRPRSTTQNFLICVFFTQVPPMISKRKGYLRKGWVIANHKEFIGSLKKAFEKKLQIEIENARDLLGTRETIDIAVKEIEQYVAKHAQIRSRFSETDFEGKDLQSHPEIFPPCMIYLFSEFEKTGRLIHAYRLQLGFFLKKIGMTVDEQLHYWFEKSVDNVGVRFEEFIRTSGYQIRHLYGLEGGKKDYNIPKCSTIATSYFCPFVHLAPNILGEFLTQNHLVKRKSIVPSQKQLERMISLSSSNPTLACSQYFPVVYGRSLYRNIAHPMQWTRYASKVEGLLEEKSSKLAEKKDKED